MATDWSAEEGLPKNPNMEYAELFFVLQSKSTTVEEKSVAKTDLMKAIVDNSESNKSYFRFKNIAHVIRFSSSNNMLVQNAVFNRSSIV